MRRIISGLIGCLLLSAALAWAEQVEIVTYYPAPATTTDDLKVKRLSVGTTYQTYNFDGTPPVTDGTALVEGNLGAGLVGGTAPPFATAPNGATTGNLNVNDVYLRSANAGAGAWVSQVTAGGMPGTMGIMYLRGHDKVPNNEPPLCPSGWTQADYRIEAATQNADNYVRTCYRTTTPCAIMYLRGHDKVPNNEPPLCPSGWTQADYRIESSNDLADNYVRTCYLCS